MLWSGTSTKDIYKTVEDAKSSFEKADGVTNNIFPQYFDYGSLNRRTDTSLRQSNILSTVINIKKSVLQPCQNLKLLGVEKKLKDMTLILAEETKIKIVGQYQ